MNTAHARSGVISAAALLLVLTAAHAAPLPAQARPLPFDPLTRAERGAAERLARTDSRVVRLLEGRDADIASMELFVPKPPDNGWPLLDRVGSLGRCADMVFSVLSGPHFGVWVRVDMRTRQVLESRRIGGAADSTADMVPFAPREIERARTLTLASEEGRRRLGDPPRGWVLEYRPLGPGDLGEPCFRSRCVAVLFRRDRTYLQSIAVVNLESGVVAFRDGAR